MKLMLRINLKQPSSLILLQFIKTNAIKLLIKAFITEAASVIEESQETVITERAFWMKKLKNSKIPTKYGHDKAKASCEVH